jgi:ubiquitin carboxyl-terminal hydrolase L5
VFIEFELEMDDWCTIESDPGVFTEIVERLGVKNVVFEELLSLDDDEGVRNLGQIHGLVFLFKYAGEQKPVLATDGGMTAEIHPELFFAKQIINNACASQAIVSVLFNSEIALDPEIAEFKNFMMALDPESRGLAIGNFEKLKTAHNAFRPRTSLEISQAENSDPESAGDAYHFVAYVKTAGGVFELDGLAANPVLIGNLAENDWVMKSVLPHIRRRVATFNESEIRFNLLAMIQDPTLVDPEHPLAAKKEKWRAENVRRMHDFTPVVIAVLQRLAATGKLADILAKLEAEQPDSPSSH